jgi:hypothetical protein
VPINSDGTKLWVTLEGVREVASVDLSALHKTLAGYTPNFWRSLRPNDRTDNYIGDRPISRITHDVFLMLQTSF